MAASTSQRSTTLIAALLAILACAEIALVASDVDNTLRYGGGAAILVALAAGTFQLSRARRNN
ncbi:hypothetical protein ABZZ17_36500 [Streptomyces sp. NPDC006512]|uniref:hypothetical protein n=1 Tax=Streptomyces sp. NPDC006512 TaxID=3154307 RepID=UPI0033A22CF6